MNKRNVSTLTGPALLFAALPLGAATFTVTRFDDPAPATCSAANCSLREAVIAANATAAEDVIELAAGTYDLKHDVGTDPQSFDLDVSAPLRIVGRGSGVTIIRNASVVANEHTRIIEVGQTSLSLSGLSLQEGHVYSSIPPIFTPLVRGGCLEAWNATLVLGDVEILGCKLVALGGYGGGIGMFQTAADLSQVSIRSSSTPQSWGGGFAAID
jgi:CSLREA domain-containing protein